jgi:hypothetical protein
MGDFFSILYQRAVKKFSEIQMTPARQNEEVIETFVVFLCKDRIMRDCVLL